jgi:hypothetical protein
MRIKADREARRRHQRVAGYALPKGPDRQRPARLRTAAGSASAFRSDHQVQSGAWQARPHRMQQGQAGVRVRVAAGGQWRTLDVHFRSRHL